MYNLVKLKALLLCVWRWKYTEKKEVIKKKLATRNDARARWTISFLFGSEKNAWNKMFSKQIKV